MRIHELVRNGDFSFNAPFRILKYLGLNDINDVETVTVFDSEVNDEIPHDVLMQFIIAINKGADGVLEIEYAE